MAFSTWSATPASNQNVDGTAATDIREGQLPSSINNAIRQVMADLVTQFGSSGNPQIATVELGHASDTTLSRGAAGFMAVESKRVPSPASQAAGDILYRGSTEWERLAKGTAFQVLRQNSGLTAPEWSTAREVLTGNRTYYVRTDGSDSNTGLTDSAGGAFLTIQKAVDVVVALDLSIYAVTIDVGNGTYNGAAVLKDYIGVGPVTITGDTGTPANVVIAVTSNNAFSGTDCGTWRLEGCKTTTATTGHHFTFTGAGANVTVGAWDYGTTGGSGYSQLQANAGALISLDTSYAVTAIGTSGRHITAFGGRVRYTAAITVTGASSLAFGTFVAADRLSSVTCDAVPTYSGFGSVTGTRYSVTLNSILYTAGGGASFFPGDAAGSAATGGQYA